MTVGKVMTFGAPKEAPVKETTMDSIVLATEAHNANRTTTPMVSSNSHYEQVRNQEILLALSVDGYDKLVPPTDIELGYVASVYENKGYTDIDRMTSKDVDAVGRKELEELNNQLKVFTKKMSGVDTRGVFELMDDLSNSVGEVDLEGVWTKAKNAKPTILARIFGLFNPQARKKSVMKQFDALAQMLEARGISLESKIGKIEDDLRVKVKALENNIKMLDEAFGLYYNAFIQLRKQFILIRLMEYNYIKQLEVFKAQNQDSQDLIMNNKILGYERVARELTTRRLLLHKTLIQLPVTSDQNVRLVGVSRNLIAEIDNTILASMPVIRMNFVGIKSAIDAERAFIVTTATRNLEANSSALLAKTTGDLTVRTEQMYGQNRLEEARRMDMLVDSVIDLKSKAREAKLSAQKDIEESQEILYNATEKLKATLNDNT